MRKDVGASPNSVSTLYRPNHDESGKYFVHTRIENDSQLERNKRIRLESLLPRGAKLGLHEGERIDYAFSIPAEEWKFFKRDYPEIAQGLIQKDETVRYKSAMQLQLLHPEWVILAGNK
jgi:hypothetical protein